MQTDDSKKRLVLLENEKTFFSIIMNYYQKRNTFSDEFRKDFSEILKTVHNGRKCVCVITGVNDCFCAGADVSTVLSKEKKGIKEYLISITNEIAKIESSTKIFISAINGYCLGGGLELAMATDYIIASKDAKFGLPEIKLGLVPGADGIKRLVRAVGRRKAFELVISGKTFSAKEALGMGLINEVVSRRKLMARAQELAEEISSKNPVAVSAIKRLSHMALYKDITNEEIKAFQDCLKTEYARKAIAAFLERK